MRRKPTYQKLANATLAKTELGAVMQPYVPYNDNALAVKELRAMTDQLAATERAGAGLRHGGRDGPAASDRAGRG